MINAKDNPIMDKLNHMGISLYLVTKDSKKPATIKSGTNPTAIFTPCFAPLTNEALLE